jgi:hypothetical protein
MPIPSQGHYGFHSFPVVDWFCLFIYEFWLFLCKIVRSSVILLLPLFTIDQSVSIQSFILRCYISANLSILWHRYSIMVNQVMVATVNISKWWLQLN